jgi:hypothetical protein
MQKAIKGEAVLFDGADRRFAEAVRRINAANPFLPERIAAERAALGAEFQEQEADWNTRPPTPASSPNNARLTERCAGLAERVRAAWPRDGRVAHADVELYEAIVGLWLYQTYAARFDAFILAALEGKGGERVDFYPAFRSDAERLFALPGLGERIGPQAAPHLFASAFQIRRAFHNIFRSLVGGSAPMARLRAAIWQSIFTHDLLRYRRGLHARMGDFSTLITGPSGTGKELVARAIGLSRYVPYDAKRAAFAQDFAAGFFPLNLAALSPTLIESELFGHRRGAFTGALADRAGWMEVCPPTGAVFLDEIGEVGTDIQVKLLRVLQARAFQPLGGTDSRRFRRENHRGDEPRSAGGDSCGAVSRRFLLPAMLGPARDALAARAARRGGGRIADAARAHRGTVARRRGGAGVHARCAGVDREESRGALRVAGEFPRAGAVRAQSGAARRVSAGGAAGAGRRGRLERHNRVGCADGGGVVAALHADRVRTGGNIEETARRLDLDRRTVKARLA